MRNVLAAAFVAIALVLGTLATQASATDPVRLLTRRVNRLENQVSNLQKQVKTLNYEVYHCEYLGSTSPVAAPDGSLGYPLYEDPACVT
jgi:hypothetical protein